MRPTLIAFLAAILLVGFGPARNSGSGGGDTSIVSISPSEVTTKIVGGTPTQERVLREVLAGLGPTRLEEVEIKKSQRKPLSVGLVVPRDVENAMAEWHSWLLVQGFAERSRELGLPAVAYSADERRAVDGESVGPVPAAQPRPTLSGAMRAAARVRKAAELHGAEVRRLEILKPNGYAFLVELRVEGDQARFLRDGLPRVLAILQPPDSGFAGDYSLIVDGHGKRVWEGVRATDGDGWHEMGGISRWDLAGCSPFFLGGPPGRGPPPCPADSPSRSLPNTRITGATPKQEAVLREILAGLAPTAITTVRVVPAGEWAPDDPSAVALRVDYSDGADANRAEWDVVLLAKAFAVRSKSLHLPAVAAHETKDGGSGLGSLSGAGRERVTAEELEASVEAAAKRSGADLVDLKLLKPNGLAFAVTLRTEEPAEFLKHRLRPFLEEVPVPSDAALDGRYVRVVDEKGRGVWSWGLWPFGGSRWTRPDLEGCSPIVPLGTLLDWSPPPCPAD